MCQLTETELLTQEPKSPPCPTLNTTKPRNVTLQTITEVCVCVARIHMCVFDMGKGKKK